MIPSLIAVYLNYTSSSDVVVDLIMVNLCQYQSMCLRCRSYKFGWWLRDRYVNLRSPFDASQPCSGQPRSLKHTSSFSPQPTRKRPISCICDCPALHEKGDLMSPRATASRNASILDIAASPPTGRSNIHGAITFAISTVNLSASGSFSTKSSMSSSGTMV